MELKNKKNKPPKHCALYTRRIRASQGERRLAGARWEEVCGEGTIALNYANFTQSLSLTSAEESRLESLEISLCEGWTEEENIYSETCLEAI